MALELEVWQAPIVDNEGNIQPGAQVTVFNSDDTIATIYDDLNRTPRSNPFNVGSDALARFYAETGRYRVQAQVGSDIAVYDDVDLSQKALREDLADPESEVLISGRLAREVAGLRDDLADPESEVLISGRLAREVAGLRDDLADPEKEVPITDSNGDSVVDLRKDLSAKNVEGIVFNLPDIKALADAPKIAGAQYSVVSFWDGWAAMLEEPSGGGIHIWNANRPKSDHNGGNIKDPDKMVELGAAGEFGTYFTPASSDSGCFELVDYETLSVEHFGAYEGVDSTAPIKACLQYCSDNLLKSKFANRKTYVVTEDMEFTYVNCDFNYSTIETSAPLYGLHVKSPPLVLSTTLASDFSVGQLPAVVLSDVTGVQKGDLISITNSEVLNPARPTTYTKGITTTVGNVIGSTVYLQDPLPFGMVAANSRVIIVRPSPKVEVKNLNLTSSNPIGSAGFGLLITCAVNSIVENTDVRGFTVGNIFYRHCVNPNTVNCHTYESYDPTRPDGSTYYGFSVACCTRPNFKKCTAFTGRSGFSTNTNAAGLPGLTEGDNRGGPNFGIVVDDCNFMSELGDVPSASPERGFDSHEGTYDITVKNTTMYRFQVFANLINFENCRITGRSDSLLSFCKNDQASRITFKGCKFEGSNRISFAGSGSGPDDDMHIDTLEFIECQSNQGNLTIQPYISLRNTTASYVINNLVLKNTKNIIVQDHDTTQIKISILRFEDIHDGLWAHYIPDVTTGDRIDLLSIRNCSWSPRVNVVNASTANKVIIDNLNYINLPASPSFRMLFLDSADIFVTNTRMNIASGGFTGIYILPDGGGGKWSTINSPRAFRTGDNLNEFAEVNNLWPA